MGRSGWDETKQMADEVSTGGIFLRLEQDHDKAIVVFLGEPYGREVIWTGERYLDADSDDGKAYLDNHPKARATTRFSMNCLVLESGNGDRVVKDERVAIFENGVTWFNDLVAIRNKYGPGIWTFEVERHGKPRDTKTTYSMLPHEKIADVAGLADKVKAATLLDLANPSGGGDATGSTSGNGVISESDKSALVADLKTLGREDLAAFLSEFGIKQVKELPSGKLSDAKAWIGAKKGGEPAPEQDPFA